MLQLGYHKLGEQRGQKRLWLEGLKLTDAGYMPGVHYRLKVEETQGELLLILDAQGDRIVSSKRRNGKVRPVIDISNADLARLFGQAERVRVIVRQGKIEVSTHPFDAARRERMERLKAKLATGDKLAIGSMSTGLGVLDHALHQGLNEAGIATHLAFAIECEHAYLQVGLDNNSVYDSTTLVVHSRMEEVETELLPKIEIIAAGLPCTGASKSGRSKNKLAFAEQHESAGTPFLAFLAVIRACNPAVVVLENVLEYQNTVSMHILREVLGEWGYITHETELGPKMGALENRHRFCAVFADKDLAFDWHGLVPVRQKEPTLATVLEDVPLESDAWKPCTYLDAKEQRDKAAGKGFRTQLIEPDVVEVGTIGKGYAKWRSTEPMIRHPGKAGYRRLLTPKEHARVKTIPEELIAGLPVTTAHECLGQSVLHTAFVAVGRLLGKTLIGSSGAITMHTVMQVTGTASKPVSEAVQAQLAF